MNQPPVKFEDLLKSEALAIISNDDKWSKDVMPDGCAACGKEFEEDEVPLHLWCHDGDWAISFHMECAFKTVSEGRDGLIRPLSKVD